MPSPEQVGAVEFDAAWTSYLVKGPLRVLSALADEAFDTPRFLEPTHVVRYRVEPGEDEGLRLQEQLDDWAVFDDESSVTAAILARATARLRHIAGLAGWAPLHGALVDRGDRRILITVRESEHQAVRPLLTDPDLEVVGYGTCLITPGAAAVVGRSCPGRPFTGRSARTSPPTEVVVLDPAAIGSGLLPLSTPDLIARVLDAVIDRQRQPLAAISTAVKALTGVPAWLAPAGHPATTVRAIRDHVG